MMNIAFCNFPKHYYINRTEELNLEVRQYLTKKNNQVICKYFDSINEIIIPYDFYFSYISKSEDITDINSIKQKFLFGDIVLVAETLDFAILGFEYLCLGYLIIPIKKENLYRLLDNMCEKNKKEIMSVQTPSGLKRFLTSNLVYVNIEGRSICYHLTDGYDIRTNALRKSFKETVNKNLLTNNTFLFLKPALIINLEKIVTINKDDMIEFDNGVFYPISKVQREKILKRILE